MVVMTVVKKVFDWVKWKENLKVDELVDLLVLATVVMSAAIWAARWAEK